MTDRPAIKPLEWEDEQQSYTCPCIHPSACDGAGLPGWSAGQVKAVAAFLKERDENVFPGEADDEERAGSARCILRVIAKVSLIDKPEAGEAVQPEYGYMRIVEIFDRNETAGAFLSEDGEGGFAAGVSRMADEIDRLRALSSSPLSAGDAGEIERLRALLDKALETLNLYADPTGYTDSYGEEIPADAEVHQGILARDTAAAIRSALRDGNGGGEP